MKKYISVFLSLILCFLLLVGCGKNATEPSTDSSTNDKTATQTEDVGSKNDNSSSELTDSNTTSSSTNIDVVTETNSYWVSKGIIEDKEKKLIYPDKMISGNTSILMNDVKGGADQEAAEKRNAILSTKDELVITGTKYYISGKGNNENDGKSPETAWKSTDVLAAYSTEFKPGDAILFERGYIYRTYNSIIAKTGLTYGAYGTGSKPVIYGSVQNYSQPNLWTPSTKKNVWKLDLALTDAGIIVFNNGEAVGNKKGGLLSLTANGDFYHNVSDNTVYLYLDKGRPNQVYNSIEIGTRRAIITLPIKTTDVRIDNLCLKYGGTFAVQCIGYHNNVNITNCEIGWIGGSFMDPSTPNSGRYGNGVQFWDSASNCSIKNCWIYQVYDAGLTFQSNENQTYENVDFNDNLIEYCSYSIEFFMRPSTYNKNNYDSGLTPANEATLKNINMNNNILRFAGYGWGNQRASSLAVSHINGWDHYYEDCTNFNIKNNIFDCSTKNIIYWGNIVNDLDQVGLNVSNNTFYQKGNTSNLTLYFGKDLQTYSTDQDSFEKSVAIFDKNPKLVKWLS